MTVRIAIIGGGNMGQALARGITRDESLDAHITVADPIGDTLRDTVPSAVDVVENNRSALENASIAILAVKPQVVESVVNPLREYFLDKIVVTVAAGIPLAKYHSWLNSRVPIVRSMPNTPTLVGAGFTGMFANEQVSVAQRDIIDKVFRSTGKLVWVENEEDLHTITALSGSGPAYFFYMMEALIEKGIAMGFDPCIAREIVVETALGAATLASKSEVDIQDLRRRITSPGGTTESAIQTFNEHEVSRGIKTGMQNAYQRSMELAESF